jgi:pimeloyl-ACP methyl ester carboxylesterase
LPWGYQMAEPIGEGAVRADAEAASDPSPVGIATTAARALALGSALASPGALRGIETDLTAIGLSRLPATWGGWERRGQIIEDSDEVLNEYGLLEEIRQREEERWIATSSDSYDLLRSERVDLWRVVAAEARQADAIAWLRMVMTDQEPTAAAAASAALARWQKRQDTAVPTSLTCAREVLTQYASSDAVDAAAIAYAALGSENAVQQQLLSDKKSSTVGRTLSIIVHGTAAWSKSWWLAGGDFHTYILQEVRPDLFSGYNAYQWSGAYNRRTRNIAAERLAGWARDSIGDCLNTVFAHSYGGVIALNATTQGLAIKDLVLLSTPAEDVRVEWRNIERAVSLRIHMDIVLLAARRAQRFTENVEEHYLPHWFWNHSDSHDPALWRSERCSEALGLVAADG